MRSRRFLRRASSIATFLLLARVFAPGRIEAEDGERRVVDPTGSVIRTIEASGAIVDRIPAPGSSGRAASNDVSNGPTLSTPNPVVDASSVRLSSDAGASVVATAAMTPIGLERITVDRIAFDAGVRWYEPRYGLALFAGLPGFTLSDGSSWSDPNTFAMAPGAFFDRVETSGTTFRYHFLPPASGFLFSFFDYATGLFASSGSFAPFGPIVLEAEAGSTTGRMLGELFIVSNYPEDDSEPNYRYFSSPAGAIVPFELTVELQDGRTFDDSTFESFVAVASASTIDLATSRRAPLVSLAIVADDQVRAGATTALVAVATYQGGLHENVAAMATWSVEPSSLATVDGGVLVTAAEGCVGTRLLIHARYVLDGIALEATKAVDCRDVVVDGSEEAWETYQGDRAHSGYVPVALDPSLFALRWQKKLVPGYALNPVAAADGKVFVTDFASYPRGAALFALDARDGALLWSREFGTAHSVNPPAYGYGNVYVQTGNHANDTYLWAFDADSGQVVFKSNHSAQWERYYAPTVVDGRVYVSGGFYGGMYAFDAFTGASRWFAALPFSDQFTPAVDDRNVYAYAGEYRPALYAFDRERGRPVFQIDDPEFDGFGFSLELAPVLGGMDDAFVIHDDRLIRFDLSARTIASEVAAGFSGQPSVAKGVVYAIESGAVEARSEASLTSIWRWEPPAGKANGPMIVTDSHLLVRVGDATHALDVATGSSEWSYPVGGSMALAEDTLYVASGSTVTAIAMPGFRVAPATRLEIVGPTTARESETTPYTALIHYADGRIRERSRTTSWSVETGASATVDSQGRLEVGELMSPTDRAVVRARYAERGVEVASELAVQLQIGISLDAFVARNVAGAIEAQRRARSALQEASEREAAAISVAGAKASGTRGGGSIWRKLVAQLRSARVWTIFARRSAERSISILEGEPDESRPPD